MPATAYERLLVCYVPAIDLRQVAAGEFPHVGRLLSTGPAVRFRTQPSIDQLATLFTGTYPHEHGLWGPRLRPDWRSRTPGQRLADLLPDIVTTTIQCARYALGEPIDLATMPPRRRRRFEWLRLNIKAVHDLDRVLEPINGRPTVYTAVGADRSRYTYQDDFWDLDGLLETVGNGDFAFELVDAHCLDHLQHWNMGDRERMHGFYRGVDDFVRALEAKCRSRGIGFVVLSDHGMEPVDRVIDLRPALEGLDAPADAYDVFIENTRATLWLHEADAGARLLDGLRASDLGILRTREDMRAYDLVFEDDAYGAAYFYARPGSTFFPNDFHQPLASLIKTLSDRQQRRRFRTPWHQADHGYLPDHDSELGFMALAADGYEPIDEFVTLIDIAPTLLDLLHVAPPESMKGTAAFRPRRT